MSTMTLVEFLLARIAEDEARARVMIEDGAPEWSDAGKPWAPTRGQVEGYDALAVPATRWLAECEAKRRIVDRLRAIEMPGHSIVHRIVGRLLENVARDSLEAALAELAIPYASHPDYREEWRPTA